MSALDIWFGLVAWVADNPRARSSTFHTVVADNPRARSSTFHTVVADNPRAWSSTFHTVVAETGNPRADEWPYFVFWSATLRHISAVRYLCTFCNWNTSVYFVKAWFTSNSRGNSVRQAKSQIMALLTQHTTNSCKISKVIQSTYQ